VDADVIVAGAGIAGLVTARHLVAAGHRVVVLEARDRVGGRTEHGRLADGTRVELGGQWLGPGQDRMYELVAELGLETFPTHLDGDLVVLFGGRRDRMPSTFRARPPLPPHVLADIAQARLRLDRLRRRVPLDAPWTGPGAVAQDARTFESWIRGNVLTTAGRSYFRLVTQGVFAAEPRQLSLRHVLYYLHAGDGLEVLTETDRGAQQDRVVGGAAAICDRLAADLDDRVRLRTPLREVRSCGDGVEVVAADDARWRARRVVVTLPPVLAGRLRYDPPLPAARDQLTQRLPAGSVAKHLAVYDRPFWREDGLSGISAADAGPVKLTYDVSPPSGTPGILLGFTEGDDARRVAALAPEQRRAAVLACFVLAFGPAAADPSEYLERDWSAEEFTRGCYGAHAGPGVWTTVGPALRRPVGPIHWAGTETSSAWNGYLEGAVRSADRVTAEVLAALA
jgi:monoamine oxidase